MARSSSEDPLKVFKFRVEMGGSRTGFSECSGLKATTEVSDYREGGDNTTPKLSPGLTKYERVTLKRGQILDEGQNDFYDWCRQVHDVASKGRAARDYRRDPEIVQMDREGNDVVRWRLHNAWPDTFKPMGDLNANSNDNSIEEVTLAYEGFEKVRV